ncbi:hypothetical protein CJ030_MR1G019573 [Morella rubra]|uniref:Uncharacterized protein n=1 Tax=Morella rubra TaxID=262757 RepID=A0A6A1WU43_9ROSI|nr:hypothetical protein CJ030_MR1G019573 [Morella rubra]
MKKEDWAPICELFSTEEFQIYILEKSEINRQNRAKLTVAHTSGSRSFQRMLALMEKMEVLQLEHESEGRSFIEVEIFTEVLGMKASYRLEEARVEIEAMSSRQIEYEELLVKSQNGRTSNGSKKNNKNRRCN